MRNPITKFNWPAWLLLLGGVCAILILTLTPSTPDNLRWVLVALVLIGAASLLVGCATFVIWVIQAMLEWIKAAESRNQKLIRIAGVAVALLISLPVLLIYVFSPIVLLPAYMIPAIINHW